MRELPGHPKPENWLARPENWVLREGRDFALLEPFADREVRGHWLFSARGKKALDLAERFLQTLAMLGIRRVWGMTPLECRAARLHTRKAGFTSMGIVQFPEGTCEVFTRVLQDNGLSDFPQ
jgi:hypothetical protein